MQNWIQRVQTIILMDISMKKTPLSISDFLAKNLHFWRENSGRFVRTAVYMYRETYCLASVLLRRINTSNKMKTWAKNFSDDKCQLYLFKRSIRSILIFLEKWFSINFLRHERKNFRLFKKLSPSSFRSVFICPEEVFGKFFSGKEVLIFMDLSKFFVEFGKKLAVKFFKSAFHMTRGTFWRKHHWKENSLKFFDDFVNFVW